MDDLHEIESVQHCDGFQFNIITKNYILGFYSTNKVCTLWSVLYFYCNWQLSAKKTKKQQHGSGREWESFFREWNGTGFSPSFFVGLGREEINFCGSETGEVWEFTPVSPSASNLCVCLTLLWNYHIKRDVLTWMQLWSRRVCFRENLFLRSFPMETVNSSSRPLM